jgi:hypothetical protein
MTGTASGVKHEERLLPDPAVARVRESGGPLDCATYACGCGYVFVALVSTSVNCPQCHAPQAW